MRTLQLKDELHSPEKEILLEHYQRHLKCEHDSTVSEIWLGMSSLEILMKTLSVQYKNSNKTRRKEFLLVIENHMFSEHTDKKDTLDSICQSN